MAATKILIAYDGSISAKAALADLKRAGLGFWVEAKVLAVADLWFPPADSFAATGEGWYSAAFANAQIASSDALDSARKLADKAAAQLRRVFPEWKVTAMADVNAPAHGILAAMEKWNPDLVLLGSRGHGLLGRILLGSVSHKVLAHASCNVRIARPVSAQMRKAAPRILLAVDGSKDSAAAVACVAGRNWERNARFHVMVVNDYRLSLAQAFQKPRRKSRSKQPPSLSEKLAERALFALAERGLRVTYSVRDGDPRLEIIREAKRFRANAVFLGSRGLGAMQRFFLGSVSLAVAETAPCAVEVVRR